MGKVNSPNLRPIECQVIRKKTILDFGPLGHFSYYKENWTSEKNCPQTFDIKL